MKPPPQPEAYNKGFNMIRTQEMLTAPFVSPQGLQGAAAIRPLLTEDLLTQSAHTSRTSTQTEK